MRLTERQAEALKYLERNGDMLFLDQSGHECVQHFKTFRRDGLIGKRGNELTDVGKQALQALKIGVRK